MAKVNINDTVVYVKNGQTSDLGKTRKDIWKVLNIFSGEITLLQSISRTEKQFTTDMHNCIKLSDLKSQGSFKKEYFNPLAWDKVNRKVSATPTFKQEYENKTVGDTNMRSNNMVKRTVDNNTTAVKNAAHIATGRTVNGVIMNKIRKQLPMIARGYADTAFGKVVLANIVDFGVKQLTPDNDKFNYVSDAMMQAAMVDLLAEIDFEAMFNEVLNGVNLGDIADASE